MMFASRSSNWLSTSLSCCHGSLGRAYRPEEVLCVGGFGHRPLKAHDLIASQAFIVMMAADEFKDTTMAANQLWLTDFTYLKVIGWGSFYLSTILDDFSRYIVAWKLSTTMKAPDVTDTLELALQAAGIDTARVVHRLRRRDWLATQTRMPKEPKKPPIDQSMG
jgi:hypothetical protein